MPMNEQYARMICQWRGADPDAPLTIGKPDGTVEQHDAGWKGYVGLADSLLALPDSAE